MALPGRESPGVSARDVLREHERLARGKRRGSGKRLEQDGGVVISRKRRFGTVTNPPSPS